ncbi:putative ribosomal protein S7 [Lyophyllum shimeji]|uniref:Ribosomal protein S7 n=1 Tax=Lyophyllum shimeji TaxID=47721 RepID=A0A9P3PGI8_LYOSH|nr:putative ribosomal protein S7 [Lyophyllum shimeji]
MNIPPAEDPLLHYFTSSLLHHGHRAAPRASPPTRDPRRGAPRAHAHAQAGREGRGEAVALGEKQRTRRAVQAILKASKSRMGRTVEERLARELIAVVQGSSKALEEKEAVHRFAMVHRGNAQTSCLIALI